MKVMVISWLFLFFAMSLVSAVNIDFSISDEVYQNAEFNVEINNIDVPGVLDVKIYVMNESEKIVSEVYSDKWQSSNYYVKSAYPADKSFKLIVKSYSGPGKICVRIRQSGKSAVLGEVCKEIEIVKKDGRGNQIINNQIANVSIGKINISSGTKSSSEPIIWKVNVNASENAVVKYESAVDEGPIVLEPKESYQTSYFRTQNLLFYGFVVMCVLIIILLALRRL